jgi:hypothetical protein
LLCSTTTEMRDEHENPGALSHGNIANEEREYTQICRSVAPHIIQLYRTDTLCKIIINNQLRDFQ